MNKGIITLLAIILVFVLMFASAHSQDEIIQVDNDMFLNPQRPVSVFRHEEHNETAEIEDCTQCHHLYEDGKLVEDESSEDMRCADCHEGKKVESTPSLMQAFHLNCKGCHQEKKSGPVMCGECHVK
jgi:glycyl-tRNA synthetase (class II)